MFVVFTTLDGSSFRVFTNKHLQHLQKQWASKDRHHGSVFGTRGEVRGNLNRGKKSTDNEITDIQTCV